MKNKFIKRSVFLVIIPGILLAFWVFASIIWNNTFSFSVLTYGHPKSTIQDHQYEKLLKGSKIQGEFVAEDNHLGIVIVKFNSYLKFDFASTDYLIFRIKEKNSPSWVYENAYRAEMLQSQLHFPFGFPIISDSKNKSYIFEIESSAGTEKTAINLQKQVPSLVTGYQYPKEEILGSKKRTVQFLFKKIVISFAQGNFILSSLIYLLPFFIYSLTLFGLLKKVNTKIYFLIGILILTIIDILVLREMNVGVLALLTVGWISLTRIAKLDSSIFFTLGFVSVFVWLLCMLFKADVIYPKLNIWVYIFLVLGSLQAVIEEKSKKKKRVSIKDIVSLLR